MAVRQVSVVGARDEERAMVHVRYAGRSLDVPMQSLELGAGSSDREIKRLLAAWLEVPENRLMDYTIDRHANGNMTLRPEAVFG